MLDSIDAVIEALGGPSKVATLCRVGLTAVGNWRARGAIPADKFMIFAEALKPIGKTAAPELFAFEPVGARP